MAAPSIRPIIVRSPYWLYKATQPVSRALVGAAASARIQEDVRALKLLPILIK